MSGLLRAPLCHLVVAASLYSLPAHAIDKIYSPNVVKGEAELEYAGSRTFDADKSKNNAQSHEFELEYGLTDRLVLEMAGEYEKQSPDHTRYSKSEIGGRVQFFEQGAHWLDSGLLLTYGVQSADHTANTVEAKLLLEKQVQKVLTRVNIGLEQEVGHYASGGPERTLEWSSRYRYSEAFEPGFEIQSNFGKSNQTNHFNEQEHYVGPAVYGRIVPGLNYEAAYYIGVSDASANSAARVLLEYELFF